MAEAAPDDIVDAGLHLRHDRAAQGRDAHRRQRRVRDRRAGRRAAASPPRRPPRRPHRCPTCRCATSPSGIFTTWFNAAAGVQVHFAESIDDRAGEPARGAADDPVRRARGSGRRSCAAVEIRMASRVAGSSARNYRFWMRAGRPRSADDAGRQRRRAHRRARAALRARLAVPLPRAARPDRHAHACRYAASGAAPIAPEVLQFFMGIGVPMHEVYGMTENTAVATGEPARAACKLGTVGEPQPGIELRIDERDRRDPHPPPRRVRRLLAQPGGDRRRRSTPTAGCTPATSASGSTAPTCGSSTASRTSSSPSGGKNISPVGDRELAEGLAVRQGGGGRSATAGPTSPR